MKGLVGGQKLRLPLREDVAEDLEKILGIRGHLAFQEEGGLKGVKRVKGLELG